MEQRLKLFETVVPYLSVDDDPELWRTVLLTLKEEFERKITVEDTHAYLWVGACSHWAHPHQAHWLQGGGFAWPSGYGDGQGFRHCGLPQFDWSVKFRFLQGVWEEAERFSGKQKVVLRVAVPGRTVRHLQAAVHTVWLRAKNKRVFWGFRKVGEDWRCVAVSDHKTQGRAVDPRFWSEPLRRSEYE